MSSRFLNDMTLIIFNNYCIDCSFLSKFCITEHLCRGVTTGYHSKFIGSPKFWQYLSSFLFWENFIYYSKRFGQFGQINRISCEVLGGIYIRTILTNFFFIHPKSMILHYSWTSQPFLYKKLRFSYISKDHFFRLGCGFGC